MRLTPDQVLDERDELRELAEWVAKWAGDQWAALMPAEQVLTDDALAFRALVEVVRGTGAVQVKWWDTLPEEWGVLDGQGWPMHAIGEPTAHEAIFRALRAVKEAGGE